MQSIDLTNIPIRIFLKDYYGITKFHKGNIIELAYDSNGKPYMVTFTYENKKQRVIPKFQSECMMGEFGKGKKRIQYTIIVETDNI